ncbi:hypothetical protein [Natronomonas marina]|uniref:hypothetical protein n=1 Tax=Natronomonas marina TaxID=2961939 RepID=UPI0020CA0AB6|nr:hypothetical protein [Natronomonas marina]
MSSPNRRSLLTSLGAVTVGGLAGCTSLLDREPPAGSLRFENDLPHAIRFEVTGVGTEPGEEPGGVTGDVTVPPAQRELTASAAVDAGTGETYEGVFTEPVWYGVRFELDGEPPENDAGETAFNPAGVDGGTTEYLTGKVYESGKFSWVVSSTDDAGRFDA